jgi:hypothetical protein
MVSLTWLGGVCELGPGGWSADVEVPFAVGGNEISEPLPGVMGPLIPLKGVGAWGAGASGTGCC